MPALKRKIPGIRLNQQDFNAVNTQRALDLICSTFNLTVENLYNAIEALQAEIDSGTGTAGDWNAETPSGPVNGSNTVYTLTSTPSDPEALILTVNGLLQYQPGDYSVSGTTITMTYAPATGSTLFAQYPT